MSRVEIYECEYVEQEQIVPRHYVTNISKCILLYEVDFNKIENTLTINYIEQLINEGETVIIDNELIEKLVEKTLNKNKYIYLLLKIKKKPY